MIITILIFILILGILVLVHEFGHFIVAKKSGMVVEEFGFGFPPRVVGIQKVNGKWKWVWWKNPLQTSENNTIYSINLIPIGGFVRIMGENNENAEHPGSFINKSFWPRFFTLVAGVVMNWVLAAVIFSVVAGLGTIQGAGQSFPAGAQVTEKRIALLEVVKKSPADMAGLKVLDSIVTIDSKDFKNSDEIRTYLLSNKGKTFVFEVKRGSDLKTFSVKSLANPGPNEGPTGIYPDDVVTVKLPFIQAVRAGVGKTFFATQFIYYQLGHLFTSGHALEQIGGPVEIGRQVGIVRAIGFVPLLELVALLSLSLAVLNLMPFPALDGGRVLFLIIEKIRGKKNNQKVEQFFNAAGFALLILLMIAVTIKDVVKG